MLCKLGESNALFEVCASAQQLATDKADDSQGIMGYWQEGGLVWCTLGQAEELLSQFPGGWYSARVK